MLSETEVTVEHGEGGENYFVSMTDMMVGMLFLFIILLMVFALNYRVGDEDSKRIKDCLTNLLQRNALLSKDIDDKVNHMQADVRRQIEALELAADQRRRLLTDLRDRLKDEKITVNVDERNGVLRLTEQSVRFETKRSDISGPAHDNIVRIARVLADVTPRYAACRADTSQRCGEFRGAALDTILIEGHTDASGIDEQNWQLSTERAIATYRAIIAESPDLREFRNRRGEEVVSVAGYSSTRPIELGNTSSAYAANRRIDLRFVMDAETTINLHDLLVLNDQVKAQIGRLAQISEESVEACK
jgi:chemotaxis protein MotB